MSVTEINYMYNVQTIYAILIMIVLHWHFYFYSISFLTCWHLANEPVTIETVVTMETNNTTLIKVLKALHNSSVPFLTLENN